MLCPCPATLNRSEISVGQDDLNPGTDPASAGSYSSHRWSLMSADLPLNELEVLIA